MLRVEVIGGVSQQETRTASARDQEPCVAIGEARSTRLSALVVGTWRSTEGALSWAD
jgi:hypothetical protein